jgi:predicted kinase
LWNSIQQLTDGTLEQVQDRIASRQGDNDASIAAIMAQMLQRQPSNRPDAAALFPHFPLLQPK